MTPLRPEEEGRALADLASIFFSVGLAVFSAIMFALREFTNAVRSRHAMDWTIASAVITTCDVKCVHGRFVDYALGLVGYSYQVDGNYYSGYCTRQFWDEQHAWTFVDSCKGKSPLIRYQADNPTASLLQMDQVSTLPVGQPPPHLLVALFSPALAILWALRNTSALAERKLREQAMTWPSTQGIVNYAEPRIVGEDTDARWVGDVSYSYSVDGESFSGSYYFAALSEDDAREMVEPWRQRKIIVHYFRGNPARSVFIPAEQHRGLINEG
jgi:hypothetical protein